jgi:transposase
MPKKKQYTISLSSDERSILKKILKRTTSINRRTRCTILLNADESLHGVQLTYQQIATLSGASLGTVFSTIKKFCNDGLDAALTPARHANSDTANLKVTGDIQAKIIAKACSAPPEGRSRWTLSLLEDEMAVILETRISRATIGRVLKNNDLRPHLNDYWCIPPKADAEFVAAMEDVLDVYQQPYDENRPLWCMDEKPFQLLGESREPIPMRPGDIAKIDSEYKRNGTCSIFCFIQPHTGKIIHSVEESRTAVDWAEKVKFLVDEVCPDAEKIVLVMDNLNTHSTASLYKAFPPEEARRIARKLEIHYTPKHGSWLDIAEIGINIMTKQCLNRRIPDIETLKKELKEWNDKYDQEPTKINWQFTNETSRVKLKSLYPDIGQCKEQRDKLREKKSQ